MELAAWSLPPGSLGRSAPRWRAASGTGGRCAARCLGYSASWASSRRSRRAGRRSGNTARWLDCRRAQPGARNVVLIVWDTVRAYNVSAYGYTRDTTPNLTQCAREGVLYSLAVAAAPWTYPSHSSFFTGQWPFKLNSQWKFPLEYSGSDPGGVLGRTRLSDRGVRGEYHLL